MRMATRHRKIRARILGHLRPLFFLSACIKRSREAADDLRVLVPLWMCVDGSEIKGVTSEASRSCSVSSVLLVECDGSAAVSGAMMDMNDCEVYLVLRLCWAVIVSDHSWCLSYHGTWLECSVGSSQVVNAVSKVEGRSSRWQGRSFEPETEAAHDDGSISGVMVCAVDRQESRVLLNLLDARHFNVFTCPGGTFDAISGAFIEDSCWNLVAQI